MNVRGTTLKKRNLGFTWFVAWLCAAQLAADDGVFDQYRDLMGDDNPAVFVIDEVGKISYAWVAENPGIEPDYEAILEHLES